MIFTTSKKKKEKKKNYVMCTDLSEELNVQCKVFADDTKIYDDVRNQRVIQDDLYQMQAWTER